MAQRSLQTRLARIETRRLARNLRGLAKRFADLIGIPEQELLAEAGRIAAASEQLGLTTWAALVAWQAAELGITPMELEAEVAGIEAALAALPTAPPAPNEPAGPA